MEVPSDSPFSEDQARHYFRDIVLGIEYCESFPSFLKAFFKLLGRPHCLPSSVSKETTLYMVLVIEHLKLNKSQDRRAKQTPTDERLTLIITHVKIKAQESSVPRNISMFVVLTHHGILLG